jgi:hypothetical protein
MKLTITSLDLEKIAETSFFEVHFFMESDIVKNHNLKVMIYDPFFNIQYVPGEHIMNVYSDKTIYWVGFDVDKTANIEKPNFKFGFRLVIEDIESNSTLYDEKHLFSPKKWISKIDNIRDNKKIVWIIGDSHAWECFGGYEHNPKNIGGYVPIRTSITSLSLIKFIKGDYSSFLNYLPIKKEDSIVFLLSSIDFQYSIHKYVSEKKQSLNNVCNKLMEDYFDVIKNIKKEYKNKLIIMSPLPPIRDGYLNKNILGSESERILCWNIFDKFWSSKENEIEYLDWTKKYKLNDNMINTNLLMSFDHHIKDYYHCISELSYKLIK